MAEISLLAAEDLMSKLLNGRVPLHAFFVSQSGAEARIAGFIDAKTAENGLVVSTSGPPIDIKQGYLKVRPFDHACKIWYGEKRELPLHLQHLADEFGESVMVISFPDFKEWFSLYFTI